MLISKRIRAGNVHAFFKLSAMKDAHAHLCSLLQEVLSPQRNSTAMNVAHDTESSSLFRCIQKPVHTGATLKDFSVQREAECYLLLIMDSYYRLKYVTEYNKRNIIVMPGGIVA